MINFQNPEIKFTIEAVRDAALLVQIVQSEMVSPALTKEDRSPVTVADYAAQALVGYRLMQAYPQDAMIGEEDSAALRQPDEAHTLERITSFVGRFVPATTSSKVCQWIDHGASQAADRYWTLDPIDGTKGFLRGDQYAVALALVYDGHVQVGALGCPQLSLGQGKGALIVAARGQGSWMTSLEGAPRFEQVHVSTQKDPAEARLLRSFESGHTNVSQIDVLAKTLGVATDPVRMDSQAKYAVLAAGGGEIYLRLLSPNRLDYREKIWDQAAGSIVIEEAGGQVTDLDGLRLDFTRGRTLAANRGICATNGFLHAETLAALKAIQA